MRHKTRSFWRRAQTKKAGPSPASITSAGMPSGALLDLDALVGEELLQLAGLEHLAGDVAAADELALDVELRDRRPVRIGLDALADLLVLEHVDALERLPDVVEDLDHLAREAAHRELRRALHEEHHVVGLHFGVDAGVG